MLIIISGGRGDGRQLEDLTESITRTIINRLRTIAMLPWKDELSAHRKFALQQAMNQGRRPNSQKNKKA
jgi:hypothetical protein